MLHPLPYPDRDLDATPPSTIPADPALDLLLADLIGQISALDDSPTRCWAWARVGSAVADQALITSAPDAPVLPILFAHGALLDTVDDLELLTDNPHLAAPALGLTYEQSIALLPAIMEWVLWEAGPPWATLAICRTMGQISGDVVDRYADLVGHLPGSPPHDE